MKKRDNPNGCIDCMFLAEVNSKKVCNEENQPKGTDGYLYLHNWEKPNDCKLRQELQERA